MYEYGCKVTRVIDGDTIDVDLDLDFDIIKVDIQSLEKEINKLDNKNPLAG
jgi:endonuclease YncB( thermonuclease family)